MAFEFFFGVFGLISTDSKTRHKSRLENDWRLFTPLSTNLFRDSSGRKSSPLSTANSAANFKPGDAQKQIFSTSGTLGAGSPTNGDGIFSSSTNSSTGSPSGSISTINSTATLIKPGNDTFSAIDSYTNKKFEFSIGSTNDKDPKGSPTDVTLGAQEDEREKEDDTIGTGSGDDTKVVNRGREIYCRLVCLFLWLNVIRLLSGLAFEKSLFTLDFYYMGATKTTFLIPAVCLAIQVAAVSTIFIRNNDETNWLVPFYSSKDYLIRSRSNFRPRMEDYTRRVNISVGAALVLAFTSSVSLSAYLIHCAWQSDSFRSLFVGDLNDPIQPVIGSVSLERCALLLVMVNDILWAIYSTFICFIVSFYFNLICSIMRSRFHSISKIIEDLAESNTRKTTNQARKITTLYLEHNEACELLDESNDFWQYLILFTYFTYIPAYCYCLYNLFFVDFAPWPSFITWVIHTHMGFIILLLSFSAAGVSTEVSRALHCIALHSVA